MKNLFTHLDDMAAHEAALRDYWSQRDTAYGRAVRKEAQQALSDLSVSMGGGRTPYLFTTQDSSAKTAHNADVTTLYEQIVQYMLPHRLSGLINLCPWSTKGCRATCLHTSGRLGMAKTAKLVRTRFFVQDPFHYLVVLLTEIERHQRRVAKCGKVLLIRFNGTGDVPIERLPFLFELVATLGTPPIWFDYTKGILTSAKQARVASPRSDYYTVASATETTSEASLVDYNENVVVVVDVKAHGALPAKFWGRDVVDGDRHDMRCLDPQGGVAVLVRAKGDARGVEGDAAGFVKSV